LIEFAAARLSSYKKPRSVEFVDSLPISATGKVLKKDLRERYTATTT
jgi:acyl-CoA synthetase (AMP-forming)/AMP-acid ligase II